MERATAQHRSVPPRLSLPRQTYQPQLVASGRPYPIFTPTPKFSSIFSPSPSPTPSKRPRSPEGPLWLFALLHLLSLYALHRSFSSSTIPIPLALFTFFALLGSALFLNVIYRSWKGRPVLPSQWGLLLVSGGVLALSCLLRFEGLRSCGPLETIFADFAGALAAKVLLDYPNKSSGTVRKARGLIALLVGTFFLSRGWARASCSPLAVDVGYRTRARIVNEPKDCVKLWSILAPSVAGFLSTFRQSMGARAPLRSIGKRRVYVLSYAVAALLLLPFAIIQLTLISGESHWQLSRSLWPLSSIVAFGMVIAFFGDFYGEEKLLMPSHSFKAFQIVTCIVCGLELLFGLDISLVGFVFCSFVLGTGVQELSLLPGQLSWEALGDTDYSTSVYASWIRSPLQHIMSDKKSRKIAIFFLINTGFMLLEFFYGFLSNSLGLISDACHMLFDCAALAIGLYASYVSRLPENSKFNYGYGRFEVVSGYANAVLLVLVASLIVLESIERILEPPEISTENLLLVSVGGLLVNLVGLVFFHEEHHHGGGGGCSHSHSSHEVNKSPHTNLHTNMVDHDHSVVTCDATVLNSELHSQGHHDVHKMAISAKPDGANGYKVIGGDVSLPDFMRGKTQTVYSSHSDKIDYRNDADLPTIPLKDKNKTVDDSTGSLEYSKLNDDSLASHFGGHQFISAKDLVCQEHHHHGHNPNHVHHHSHSHEQIVSSAAVHERKQGHHDNHEHNNACQHEGHQFCDHAHQLHQDQDHQLHQDHGQQQDMGHSQTHQHLNAHKHDHNEHQGHCHDHSHNHDHDQHLGHFHDHSHNHDHNEHHGHDHDHSHNHDHDQHLGHFHDHDDHDDHDHDHHKHTHNNRDHAHDDHHSHMDHNMYGIFLHVLADTLGSVGVVISTVLIKYKGWLITDPACSIILSALIIGSVIPLLRNSAEILLQRVPRFNENDLKRALKDISMIVGVKNCQRVHVWSFTNTNIIGTLHLQISAGSDKKLIRENVSQLLHDAGVVDLTLQIEEM